MTESIPANPPALPAVTKPISYVWTTTAGGALIALGSFLPWMSATTIFGTLSKSGLDGGGDGLFTLAVGALFVVLGLTALSGVSDRRRWITVALGSVLAILLVVELVDLNKRVAGIPTSPFAYANVGPGIWVLFLGTAVVFLGAFIGLRGGRR